MESAPRADPDRARSPDPAQEGGADSITGGYSFSGSGLYEWPVSPGLSVPRSYTHFTAEVTGLKSVFGTSQDLSDRTALLIGKSGRRGIWAAEGVSRSEHAAIWPNSLKFIMYDVCITQMHIRPPFSAFQQTVLAKLGVAPSQLHPNGWAFLRAYELICRWLERPVSADLFFNLFEIQRNSGNKNAAPGRAHVSFRSVRKSRVFQLYSDSLKGHGWKSRFYWVTPTDAPTKSLIGRFSEDGQDVVYTAFQLGWSMDHYDHPPGHYRVANESLSEEDQKTKKMLIACADALPFADDPEKRGFHTPSLVHARNAPRVLAAISNMLPDSDEEWLRSVAFSAAEDVVATPPPVRSPIAAVPVTQVETTHPGIVGLVGEEERAATPEPPRQEKRKRRAGDRGDRATKHKRKSASQRSGSTSRYRSFALDEQFVQKSYEEYVADPIAASVHCMLHLQDLANEERRRCELQVAEAQSSRDSALAELEFTKSNLNMATLSLATVRTTLKMVEQQRDDLSLKGAELENKIAELEAARESADLEVERLRSKVGELEEKLRNAATVAESSGSQARVVELEKALAQSEEKARKTAQLALGMKDKGFKQALQQVLVVNPSMESLSAVLQPYHTVEDGKIVRVDPATKNKVVVYPPA